MTRRKGREIIDYERWYVQHETEKAILVSEAHDSKNTERFWLPKSQVEITHEHRKKHDRRVIDFSIPLSLAEEKGMDQ